MPNHSHRAGPLRQSNKRNKRSKSSKRTINRLAGGKVEGGRRSGAFKQRLVAQTKADRRHIQQQRREAKRLEILRKRRGLDGGPSPPRIVGIINLGEEGRNMDENHQKSNNIEERLRSLILEQADSVLKTSGDSINSTISAKYNVHKKDGNLTILTNSTAFASHYKNNAASSSTDASLSSDDGAVMAALDLCRVCDIILFVIDADATNIDEANILGMNIGGGDDSKSHGTNKTGATSTRDWDYLISERGDRILTAVKGQGLPKIITVIAKTTSASGPETTFGLGHNDDDDDDDDHMTTQSAKSIRRAAFKRKNDIKKYISRFATTEFGVDNDKVVEVKLDNNNNNNIDDDVNANMDVVVDVATGTTKTSDSNRMINPEEHSKRVLASSLIRTLCTTSAAPAKWVSELPRAYILSDRHTYDPSGNELHITGYVRGMAPLDVNALIHLPNVGTFACKSVKRTKQPLVLSSALQKKHQMIQKMGHDDDDLNVPVEADPMKRESLEMFATPDALEGEQNLIGFDEEEEDDFVDDDDADDVKKGTTKDENPFARPAGWSDYQAAWLDAVDNDVVDDTDFDRGELAGELNNKKTNATSATSGGGTVADADDADGMDLDDANRISADEKRALIEQRRKEQREHTEFPDEVQVDEDDKARDRFARYRSLKSFRKSYWDPKENLPDTYSSIYHFSNFRATQRSVMAEMKDVIKAARACEGKFWGSTPKEDNDDDTEMGKNDYGSDGYDDDDDDDFLSGCIPTGSYITLTLEGVNKKDAMNIQPSTLLSAVSLLPHENKVSVLHMGLTNKREDEDVDDANIGNDNTDNVLPVKSKDVLTFRCGWRTWTGRPVFSQNNLNCDKHKFERYIPSQRGTFFAASIFGPVTYSPCPVLVFRTTNTTTTTRTTNSSSGEGGEEETRGNEGQGKQRYELVATGSMIGADADRLIVKRIVLTGYPVRVHKRFATVKYMFYDPEDVKWFKPAGIMTKHGLTGKIEESVGDHGTMKCLFNAPIKQHDTVCLPLYKRIYPKFAEETSTNEESTMRTTRKNTLVVK